MDVKVCDESHRLDYRTSEKGCQCFGESLTLEEEREIEVESGPPRRTKEKTPGAPGNRKPHDL
jgi:hypothetical protein